jgi:hypothetical protein
VNWCDRFPEANLLTWLMMNLMVMVMVMMVMVMVMKAFSMLYRVVLD